MKEKIAIIILNYNGAKYILNCLEALKKAAATKTNFKLIVVDNASQDNSVTLIKTNFPQTKIIKNKKNLGFAAGINIAIKYALKNKFKFLLILNPDTTVEKNFLLPLIKTAKENQKIGIAAPLLKEYTPNKKTLYSSGLNFNAILGRTKHVKFTTKPKNKVEFKLVSGCAMLIKSEVFKEIGFFDERFFLYFEDSDFCLRTIKAGFKIYVEPKSVVCHAANTSLYEFPILKIKHNLLSNLLFIIKWVKSYYWPIAFSYLTILGFKMIFTLSVQKSLKK